MLAGTLLVIAGAVIAVKRTLHGSSDLRGFHRNWSANLERPTLPERREGPDSEDPDPYPPSSYILFAPLGALPLWSVGLLWYALNLACTYGIWRQARALLGNDSPRAIACAGIAVLPFWLGNLFAGQNAPLLMFMILSAYALAVRQRSFWSGSLIALATLIKVVPVLFLLPFVVRRDMRALGGFAATLLVVVGGLGSLFFGPATNVDFHRRWFEFVTVGSEGPADPRVPNSMRSSIRSNNQSFEAVLARLTMDVPADRGRRAFQVNLARLDAPQWRALRVAGIGALLLVVAAALGWREWKRMAVGESPTGTDWARDFGLIASLMLIISPIVWSHYYVWMLVPLALTWHERGALGRGMVVAWTIAGWLIGVPFARAIGVNLWATAMLLADQLRPQGRAEASVSPELPGPMFAARRIAA
jgi:hypothetical protein